MQDRSASRFLPDMMAPNIFVGLSAWFSETVDPSVKHAWFRGGGQVETKEEADFVICTQFSEGVVERQPKSRYPIAVFHPDWILKSYNEGRVLSVGQFLILYPDLIKEVNRLFP